MQINETEDTLKNKITVSEIEDSEMIKITVKDENPVKAMKIANEVTKVFAKTVADIYKINNVYTVDEAEEPITPCNINHVRDIVIFLVIGLVISIIYVLITNMFDNTIKDADDIETNSELITLVSIPFVNEDNKKGEYTKMKNELITFVSPKTQISEVFRTLRTNIQFMNVDEGLKSLLITSTVPGEGKAGLHQI